jgi:glycosyltransferase involved in cell wall biosynthesis
MDNTSQVVSNFRDSRIKYIRHETNKGAPAARNTGIKISSGQYIAFLDDDDEWLPEKLRMQVKLLENTSERIGCVYTGCFFVDRNTGKIVFQYIPSKRGDLSDELVVRNCIGATSTPLLRRECFERVGLFDENLPSYQDYDMWIRISKEFHFEYIKESLVRSYMHENQITTNPAAISKGFELMLMKYGHFPSLRRTLSYRYLIMGIFYCYSNDIKGGRRMFLKAIKLHPFEIKHYFNLGLSLLGADNFRKLKELKGKVTALLRLC